MKILFIADDCDPRTLGGIQTFGRVLGKFFNNKIFFITYSNKKKKYII